MSPKLLKLFAHERRSSSLFGIINKIIQTGKILSQWKLADVISVHIGNFKENVEYYRPVPLMSVVSEIAERCVF